MEKNSSADCISIIVSEETGKISISQNGKLKRNISSNELKTIIIKEFGTGDSEKSQTKKTFLGKIADWMVKKS